MGKEQSPEMPVRFYRTEAGGSPVLDWLRGLDKDDRHAIALDLMRVQFGWPIGRPLVGSLKDGLWGSALIASRASGPPGSSCIFTTRCSSCCTGSSRKRRKRPGMMWP